MSDVNEGFWQPDPFGRHAQRYFDGANWTQNVIDKSGRQTTDPPVSWVPSATAPTKRGPQPLSMVMAVTGALFAVLSLFVLNWFEFRTSENDELRATGNSTVEAKLGLSVSEITDGLKFTEIKTIAENTEGDTLSGATDQYFTFGYLVAVGAAVVGVLALFSSGLQRPLAIAVVLVAGWHANTVNDLSDNTVDTKVGAWLGAVGLLMVAVALMLPRRENAPSTLVG